MRTREMIISMTLFVFSTTALLLFVEIGLRLFSPQQESAQWFESSKKYGYFLKKSFYQDYSFAGHNFIMHVQTNSFGHRYKEYDKTDFQNTKIKKVLLLGDSFMFGHGINMEDHMATHLESMLNANGSSFSIINSGVGGWGTLQQTAYAKDHFELFNADFIVFLFCGNDPDDDNKFLAHMKDNEKGLFYFPGKIFLRDNLHLYRYVYYKSHILLHNFVLAKKSRDIPNIIINTQSGSAITSEQWERTLKNINIFHEEYLRFNKRGITLVLSTSPWDENERDYLDTLSNGENLFYIDLYNETINLPLDERRLEHDGHWSVKMHYVNAKKISEFIVNKINSIK